MNYSLTLGSRTRVCEGPERRERAKNFQSHYFATTKKGATGRKKEEYSYEHNKKIGKHIRLGINIHGQGGNGEGHERSSGRLFFFMCVVGYEPILTVSARLAPVGSPAFCLNPESGT